MRACVLTTVHPYNDNRIFYKQIRTLLKAGYQVTYIAPCPPGVNRLEGIDLVPLPRLPRSHRPLNWWRALRAALRSRADIFHFHDPELIGVGLLLRMLTGRPVIYDIHESYPQAVLGKRWIPGWSRPLIAKAVRLLEWLAGRAFDGIVVPVPVIYERFRRSSRRSVLVHNYVDLGLFDYEEEGASPVLAQPYFVYAGSISTDRGALDCLAAFERLSREDVHLILVGRRSDTDPSVRDLPGHLSRGVYLLDMQPFERIPSLLRRSRAGLAPIRATPQYLDALPTKVLEYMAASKPVIASDLPLVRGIIEEAGCGLLVEPGNVEQLAEAMAYILDHPAEAEEMGRRGRRAVVERYSWETEGQRLLGLYEEVLGSNPHTEMENA
ncbi:MAG TPA: glycosyltransferase WbuB [Anaerolineae bacterium]|nr:glycosyltransferase WbuB [Anaerolineae bacterium]